jgi:hypothetical protein
MVGVRDPAACLDPWDWGSYERARCLLPGTSRCDSPGAVADCGENTRHGPGMPAQPDGLYSTYITPLAINPPTE